MNIIENIKTFFKEQGLNWNGLIATGKDKDFREATEKDFEVLNNIDFWISFGSDGRCLYRGAIYGRSMPLQCLCSA